MPRKLHSNSPSYNVTATSTGANSVNETIILIECRDLFWEILRADPRGKNGKTRTGKSTYWVVGTKQDASLRWEHVEIIRAGSPVRRFEGGARVCRVFQASDVEATNIEATVMTYFSLIPLA
jgi:hypothetical protein